MAKQIVTDATDAAPMAPAFINLLLRPEGATPEELKIAMNRAWQPRLATMEKVATDWGYKALAITVDENARWVFRPTKKAVAPAPMPTKRSKPAAKKATKPEPKPTAKKAAPAAKKVAAKKATTTERAAPQRRAVLMEAAAQGILPAAPDFSAATHTRFRPKLDAIIALVEAKDVKGLKAMTINPTSSSPKAMARYRDAAVTAFEAMAAAAKAKKPAAKAKAAR